MGDEAEADVPKDVPEAGDKVPEGVPQDVPPEGDAEVPTEAVTLPVEETTTVLPDQVTTPEPPPEQEKAVVLPIYIYTAIFGAIFLLGPLLVRRGPNVGITRCCIMLSAFCCWVFWTTTYIVQLNPLLGPRLSNMTLAWIGHKWGKNAVGILGVNETDDSEDLPSRRSYNDTSLLSNLTGVLKA